MLRYLSKKQKLEGHQSAAADSNNDYVVTFDDLGVDELANIFAFLQLKHIMRSRRVNKKSREAVKMTNVPLNADFVVMGLRKYNTLNVMTRAMPNLQQITIDFLGNGHKWSDGEDPNERVAARTANYTTHDIGIISNFSKLRKLEIDVSLNGRYPVLFNSFPLLQKLSLQSCTYLKWDLELLAGLPLLKELDCIGNRYLSGNISSLRVLKETLEIVRIRNCKNVEGNFMELADFPHLREVNLIETAVSGDIREIGKTDFSMLEQLSLPDGVHGARDYEFQSISDGPELATAVYLLQKQRPALKMDDWCGVLSRDSPDWYTPAEFDISYLPFSIHFVTAGNRVGYRWNVYGHWCEVNWLDPEPDKDSSDYEEYIEELQEIERSGLLNGLHEPPTEEEYNRLLEEYDDEISE